jgi:hypothetical protein
MAQTIVSGSDSYCSAEQLFSFVDSREIAGLLRDSDTEDLPSRSEMLDDTDAAGALLAALLRAGSGEVEAACLPRGQYTAEDLAAIAASTTNAGYHLQRVTAGCTILAAFGRRHTASGAGPDDYLAVRHAREALERLRVGEHVFGLAANIEAGKGMDAVPFIDPNAGQNRLVNVARAYFGSRCRGE